MDVLRRQDFHVQLPGLRHDAVLGWITGDQPLLYGPVQGTVEHQVDATDGSGAQARILALSNVYSAALQ